MIAAEGIIYIKNKPSAGGSAMSVPKYNIIKPITTAPIIQTFDAQWHLANGSYDRPNMPMTDKPLILVDFYNLHPSAGANVWGHYKNITNETGGYWDELNDTYHLVDGTLSNAATVFPSTNDWAQVHAFDIDVLMNKSGSPSVATQTNIQTYSEIGIAVGGHVNTGVPATDHRVACIEELLAMAVRKSANSGLDHSYAPTSYKLFDMPPFAYSNPPASCTYLDDVGSNGTTLLGRLFIMSSVYNTQFTNSSGTESLMIVRNGNRS